MLLSELKKKYPYIDIFFESTKPEHVDDSIEYITKMFNSIKVEFQKNYQNNLIKRMK